MWNKIGQKGLCICTNWPKIQNKFSEDVIKMPIQINGKTRSLIEIVNDEDKEGVINKVMADLKVIKNLEEKKVLKTIFVKNKIVNLVVK